MNLPLAPLAALVLGLAAALGVLAMPLDVLESLVMDSGLPAVLQAAEPPLGQVARAGLAIGAAAVAALLGWFMAFILVGTRGLSVGTPADALDTDHAPTIRRADAHPDAPPRQPLMATRDLGTPFLEVRAVAEPEPEPKPEPKPELGLEREDVVAPAVEAAPEPVAEIQARPIEITPPAIVAPPVEQDLPLDLSQPLAAYDPQAVPERPRPKPVPLAPLRREPRPAVFDETERFEVFELTPPVRPKPVPAPAPFPISAPAEAIVRPETDASVHALLERLERGVVRKGLVTAVEPTPRGDAERGAERGLEDALVTLRNLARRA